MWTTTSSRDNWERLVAAVIKRDQIRQLCHQDSISTVDSDLSDRPLSLRSASSAPSPQFSLSRKSIVEVEARKGGSGTITQKLFSALFRRNKPKEFGLVGSSEDHFGVESFSLRELRVATDNFSDRNILGRGGFSRVYKGRLADGSLVAVKKYKEGAVSEVRMKEELEISSIIVAHRNVIDLHGSCITEKEHLLVYPYMANRSVAQCLRERGGSESPLNWPIRRQIALDVAKGLAHLHHGCTRPIIHRDIKASNILLDEDFQALVSDFTLAKFMDSNDDDGVVEGTIGHVAPEYLSQGKCTLKTDVYGYGFFLLELISGQRPYYDLARLASNDKVMVVDWVKQLLEEKNFERMLGLARLDKGDDVKLLGWVSDRKLLGWVKKFLEEKNVERMVDRDLRGKFDREGVEKLIQIALVCTLIDPDGRPTMSEVVMMLEDGHCLTKTWEAFSSNIYNLDNYSSEILSNEEWITVYSRLGITPDELSGPRWSNKLMRQLQRNLTEK